MNQDSFHDGGGTRRVSIVTDSVAGLPPDLVRQYDIKVVPVGNILYDGQCYTDGVTITLKQAYDLLRKDPDKFHTTAVTPGYLLDAYREIGKTSQNIVFVTISAALSAVSQSATVAAKIYQLESPQTNIRIVDSKMASSGQGLVVLAAARAAAQGRDLDQIAQAALELRQNTHNLILLDTVRYVYRTGRMPKIASKLGSMLGVKPIARITEKGQMRAIGLCRTRDSGIGRIIKEIRKLAKENPLQVMVMHADGPEPATQLANTLNQEFNCVEMIIGEFSAVMGYSAGPGALAIGFHPEPTPT